MFMSIVQLLFDYSRAAGNVFQSKYIFYLEIYPGSSSFKLVISIFIKLKPFQTCVDNNDYTVIHIRIALESCQFLYLYSSKSAD